MDSSKIPSVQLFGKNSEEEFELEVYCEICSEIVPNENLRDHAKSIIHQTKLKSN